MLNDAGLCCCLLSFIASVSVELAFGRFFLFGRCVPFCVVFDVVEDLFGGFASFDFGLCWFDILRFCLAVSRFCILALFWVLVFVINVKLF